MRHRILLVEDNTDDWLLVRRALRQMHEHAFELETVPDGQDALDYLLEHKDSQPALVLLDLKMPKMNGHEVLLFLRGREAFKSLPIVVFSSSDEAADIDKAMDYGATEYVRKPTHFEDYMGTVQRLVRRYVTQAG